ncbi:MAG: Ig-like domain-containing protein, partial [Bacteroidota bacterium]
MIPFRSFCWRILILTGLALSVWACAQPGTLTGGPRDEIPPTVQRTEPAAASLFFEGQSVKIVFSEPVRKPTFGKEIFISPLVKRPKIIQSDSGKRIRIEFDEPLRPETTYLITLKEIKDATESN